MKSTGGEFGLQPHRLLSFREGRCSEWDGDEAAMLPAFHLVGSLAFDLIFD